MRHVSFATLICVAGCLPLWALARSHQLPWGCLSATSRATPTWAQPAGSACTVAPVQAWFVAEGLPLISPWQTRRLKYGNHMSIQTLLICSEAAMYSAGVLCAMVCWCAEDRAAMNSTFGHSLYGHSLLVPLCRFWMPTTHRRPPPALWPSIA